MRKIILTGLLCLSSLVLAKEDVDVAMVLATDVSGSIVEEGYVAEYTMQVTGIAKALRDPELGRILESCNGAGLALTYVEWSSGSVYQDTKQVIGWRKLMNAADLRAFADEVDKIRQRSSEGNTNLIKALRDSARLLKDAPYRAVRQFISLSSDGEQNVSVPFKGSVAATPLSMAEALAEVRDEVVQEGIVIDALVLTTDRGRSSGIELEDYFKRFVVGGPGHFVVPVADFESYADGLAAKLKRELDHCAF